MKIINFVSGGDNGGVKQCFLHYQLALQELGFNAVASARSNFPCFEQLEQITKDYKISSYIRSDLPFIREYSVAKLKEFFAELKPDIILVHKNIDFKLVKLAVGDSAKVVGILHGYNHSYCEYPDFFIAVSKGVEKYIREKISSDKIIFQLYNPVNLFEPEPDSFKFHQVPTLGTMALFKRKKKIGDLLEVAKILYLDNIKFKVLIAGKRKRLEYFYKLQNIINGTTSVLSFLPWVKDKIKFFDDIDIFCLNSSSESFGMVLTEAMARKKIVVSTDCDGPKEIITHGVNGFLVERNNPRAFAEVIKDILANKYDLVKITEQGFLRAKELSIDNFRSNLKDIINKIAN
jgi:glycosyltransferase involved in cell wall biosynthesis